MRASLRLAGLLAALSLASACGGGHRPPPLPPSTKLFLIDQARSTFEPARAAALADAAALSRAATLRDALDTAAGTGAYDPAKKASDQAGGADRAAVTAAAALPSHVAAYQASIAGLESAATAAGLSAPRAAAVVAVATAARTEAGALAALAQSEPARRKAYAALAAIQDLWVSRAGAGYYQDQRTLGYSATVAAASYQVLTNDVRAGVRSARASLAQRVQALARATTAVRAALAQVQVQLAPLVGSPSATLAG